MPGGPRFVGRERELTLLSAGLTEALAGHVRTFLLVGEPGIGKTRLAEMVQGRAQAQGARVCWGRCWEEGGAPAFWPWIQVLRELLEDMDPATIASQMGSAASYVVQLVPELAQRVGAPEPSTSPDAQHARFTIFDGIATFLRGVACRQPIAIVLDDLHAADVPSLLLAVFLARHLTGTRVLLIGIYRDVDPKPSAEVERLLGELGREAVVLSLSGLTVPDVVGFLTDGLGSRPVSSVAAAILETTGGNPFFLTEVVHEIVL